MWTVFVIGCAGSTWCHCCWWWPPQVVASGRRGVGGHLGRQRPRGRCQHPSRPPQCRPSLLLLVVSAVIAVCSDSSHCRRSGSIMLTRHGSSVCSDSSHCKRSIRAQVSLPGAAGRGVGGSRRFVRHGTLGSHSWLLWPALCCRRRFRL